MASRARSTKQRGSSRRRSDLPYELLHGDCVESMRAMADGSIDAVVTDPPYGINFMGKAWDGAEITAAVQRGLDPGGDATRAARLKERRSEDTMQTVSGFANRSSEAGSYDFSPRGMVAFQEWTRGWAAEALRVLKPGGHLLSFSSPRTYHRMAVGVEEAGFEIRDSVHWLFGSGFPKSMDVAKAIDRHLGVEPTVVGRATGTERPGFAGERYADDPDRVYNGRGSLPVDFEITEPTSDEAKAWAGWGTALKPAHEPVVFARKPLDGSVAANVLAHGTGALNVDASLVGSEPGTRSVVRGERTAGAVTSFGGGSLVTEPADGRWPANLILSHLPECQGVGAKHTELLCAPGCPVAELNLMSDGGARFFYIPKADRRERVGGAITNLHPTVKPVDLMRHLVRLVTPPDGVVLDPFLGSGTTGCAAMAEGFRFVGCEREDEYFEVAKARIADWAFAHGRL